MPDVTLEPDVSGPRDDRDGLLVRTPFDGAFLTALKASIPVPDRIWVMDLGAWWVAAAHRDLVIQLCLQAFGSVLCYGGAREPDVWIDRDGVVRQERLL